MGHDPDRLSLFNNTLALQIIIIRTMEIGHSLVGNFNNASGQRGNKLAVMGNKDQCTRVVLQGQVECFDTSMSIWLVGTSSNRTLGFC